MSAKPKRPPRETRFAQSVEDFLKHLSERERSENTVRCYRHDLALFASWYADAYKAELSDLAEITAVELREWKRDMIARKDRPASVNRRLSAVQSFERWAADVGRITGAPDRPAQVREERPGPRWLDQTERRALLHVAEKAGVRNRSLVHVFLNTGLRVAEMSALEWPDVRIGSGNRKDVVVVRRGKGAKYREVPLNEDARKAFMDRGGPGQAGPVWMGPRGPLTASGMGQLVSALGKKAGLDLSCHILRHTFCHDLLAAGVSIEKVASLAGHDSIETTRRYVEPSQADLMDAVEALSARDDAGPAQAPRRARNGRGR